jgi:hypothetical protein
VIDDATMNALFDQEAKLFRAENPSMALIMNT